MISSNLLFLNLTQILLNLKCNNFLVTQNLKKPEGEHIYKKEVDNDI